jgi:hypothetical protein
MPAPDARYLIAALRQTLWTLNKPYELWVREFGQVLASEQRVAGHVFGMNEHLRGLLLAQLSNQRPWHPIARNLHVIEQIFLGYDAARLQLAEPEELRDKVCGIQCGNRAIAKQLKALRTNIETLKRVAQQFGSVDAFVTSDDPFVIARCLSTPKSPFKVRQLGFTLALEYLRNVGIRAGKPDLHIRRILSGERLGYFAGVPKETEAALKISTLAAESGINPTYLDNLLWIYCAQSYGEVCTAKPSCGVCALASTCNYPRSLGSLPLPSG